MHYHGSSKTVFVQKIKKEHRTMWQGEAYYDRRRALEHQQQMGGDVRDARREQEVVIRQLNKAFKQLRTFFVTRRRSLQLTLLSLFTHRIVRPKG